MYIKFMKPFRPADTLGGSFFHRTSAENPELDTVSDLWFPRNIRVDWHSHPGEQWEFFLQGPGITVWEDRIHRCVLEPGDAYLVPPGVPHRLVEIRSERAQFLYSEWQLGRFIRRCLPQFSTAIDRHRRTLGLHAASGNRLRPGMDLLLATAAQAGSHRELRIGLALQSLAVHLLEWVADGDRLPERAERGEILAAQRRMDQDPSRRWLLDELAQGSGLTGQQLCVLFGQEVGRTPHQYLLHTRIARCQQQLTTTDLSITAIANQLGFASSQHLARVFKQHTGMTPRAYRVGKTATPPER
jgi:AraC-like DNA-binding protein